MSTTPSTHVSGHVMPADQPLVAHMRYSDVSGFANEQESCIHLLLRFGDNETQADIHVKLSPKMAFKNFNAWHKNRPMPFEGLVAIGAHGGRLVIERVYLCGLWHVVTD